MKNHQWCVLILFCLFAKTTLSAQECQLTVRGKVIDQSTQHALEFANLFLVETQRGTISDSSGFFQIEKVCPGDYHLSVGHIGCEATEIFLKVRQDTFIEIRLSHHVELLNEVVVQGSQSANTTEVSNTITEEAIASKSNKNLSDILEQIAGVSVLRSGAGISKPVIHGLSGNRVAILNNGIAQAGQQWGNDHAPEIDPFVADHLSVIKGAGALAYSGTSLGSVVLVENGKIQDDPHLHGAFNYIFQSNGRGHTLNAMLENRHHWAAWRVKGTIKRIGDQHTPDYFLTNTGKQENNIAVQIEKSFTNRWQNQLYYSFFNTDIAILRGSHVGNLTDLTNAVDRTIPFFTQDDFSYDIAAPRQAVSHHLLKFESKYFLTDTQVLKLKYGGQLNQRKEFDVRRGGRTSMPSMSLDQTTHFLETAYQATLRNGFLMKTGVQFNIVENTNNPETGILPLIPNYNSFHTASFFILQKEKEQWFYELGARYDYKMLKVQTITNTIPRRIEKIDHQFHNYAFSVGTQYTFSKNLKTNLNVAYLLRAPEVNELYSAGLHQGVSGIEEGNRNLSSEKSFKTVFSTDWNVHQKLFIQALAYFHHIQDYIYLQAESEFRLTIRGAFPVFSYQQVDANLYGFDLLLKYELSDQLKMVNRFAFIEGRDRSNRLALVNIPSNNISTELTYSLPDQNHFKNNFFQLNGKYVFQQDDINLEQDFTPPPAAYFLLGAALGTQFSFKESKLKFSLRAENLLNARYRDYLNRFRYFADELGFNLSLNLNYSF